MWPLNLAIFGPKGHNLNKLGRGSPDDATYKYDHGSWHSGFRQEYIFMAYSKHVTPGWGGPIWPQDHNFNKFGDA